MKGRKFNKGDYKILSLILLAAVIASSGIYISKYFQGVNQCQLNTR